MTAPRRLALTGLLCGALFAFTGGAPASAAPDSDSVLRKGQQELDFGFGYAFDLDLPGDHNRDSVQWYSFVPRFGHFFTSRREVLLEVPISYYVDPENEWGVGLELTLRQHFAKYGRFLPFWEVGGGGSFWKLDLRDLLGELQFILHWGAGFRYLLNDESSLTLTGRFHHYSNAGLRSRNRGVNDLLFLVSYTRFLR